MYQCVPRLAKGIGEPLEELKKLNEKLINLQAAAMVQAPDRWACVCVCVCVCKSRCVTLLIGMYVFLFGKLTFHQGKEG